MAAIATDHTHPPHLQWSAGNILAAIGIASVAMGIIIALTLNGIDNSRIDALNTRVDGVQDRLHTIRDTQLDTQNEIMVIQQDVTIMKQDIADIKETLERIEAAQQEN